MPASRALIFALALLARSFLSTAPQTAATINGSADIYNLNDVYELIKIEHGDGSRTAFKYDRNGNTEEKALVNAGAPTACLVRYLNATGSEKRCTVEVDGISTETLRLPPGGGNLWLGASTIPPVNNLKLTIAAEDFAANGPCELRIDALVIVKGPKQNVYEAELATLTNVTTGPAELASNALFETGTDVANATSVAHFHRSNQLTGVAGRARCHSRDGTDVANATSVAHFHGSNQQTGVTGRSVLPADVDWRGDR